MKNGANLEWKQIQHRLRERVKELTCLHGVSQLIAENPNDLERLLQRVAALLPPSWQYPESTCGRVLLNGKEYATTNFKVTEWKQTAVIKIDGKQAGAVEVYYLDEMPELDEGPFLKEERLLIDAVAVQISRAAQRARLEQQLRERVKELSCLYGVSQLIAENPGAPEVIFQGAANLLPPSWQYPEITCGRVLFEGDEYTSPGFRATEWKQTAVIKIEGAKVGAVEVYYLEEMPVLDEGPFLKEERLLIDAVAERIGRAAQRIKWEHLLQVERTALERSKTALEEVLANVEDEKREIEKRVETNIDKVVMPILQDLEARVSDDSRGYVGLLKRHLQEIVSPFSSELLKKFSVLAPAEVEICNMIRNGLTSKQIARIRRVSPATVSRQRENIRRKLDLTNKDINLATFLCAFGAE